MLSLTIYKRLRNTSQAARATSNHINTSDPSVPTPRLHVSRCNNIVSVSRVFNMTEKSKRITEYLEDHIEIWRGDPEFMAKYKVVVDYIRNILKLDLDEDRILRVITSSYTNDFSHTLPHGNQAQLMFPLTAMMNHSCQPSISRWGNTFEIHTNNNQKYIN